MHLIYFVSTIVPQNCGGVNILFPFLTDVVSNFEEGINSKLALRKYLPVNMKFKHPVAFDI